MKKLFWISAALIFGMEITHAQGLLNKIKSKANQELNKLENGSNTKPASPPNKNILSANVTRTVVATIAQDEDFDYQESCIDLGASLNQISFIVNKRIGNGMQCFSYKNGIRTAVPCPTPNSACQTPMQCSYTQLRKIEDGSDEMKKYVIDHSTHIQTPTYTDEQLKQMSAYMTKEQVEQMKQAMKEAKAISYVDNRTISFNGKKYGPFKLLQDFYLTPDSKHFYATIADKDYKVITSASASVVTSPGMTPPLAILAAPDNSEFATYSVDESGQNFSIHTSTGKTYKISDPGYYQAGWYTASGNHIVTFVKESVLIDGKVVKTFDANSSPKACDIFVSSDAKGVAVVNDNTISFPDGDYFQYPLKMALINTGGKVYFKWLAMEDKQIVLYQKPF
jgi:hypothetical protein